MRGRKGRRWRSHWCHAWHRPVRDTRTGKVTQPPTVGLRGHASTDPCSAVTSWPDPRACGVQPWPHTDRPTAPRGPVPAGPRGPAAARAEPPRRGKRASRGAPAPYRAHFLVKTRSNLHPAAGSTCSSSGFKEEARRGFGTTRGAGTAKHWGAVAGEERGTSPAGRSDPRALSAGTAGWEKPRLGSSKGGSQTKQKRKWEREVGETLKEAGLGTGAARQRAGKAEVPAAKRALLGASCASVGAS